MKLVSFAMQNSSNMSDRIAWKSRTKISVQSPEDMADASVRTKKLLPKTLQNIVYDLTHIFRTLTPNDYVSVYTNESILCVLVKNFCGFAKALLFGGFVKSGIAHAFSINASRSCVAFLNTLSLEN